MVIYCRLVVRITDAIIHTKSTKNG